ncbi:copper amine oxidase N-terminal domain-containing protein [Desulfofundulus sp. TPOSR]|uniref:copper amine oxidase N-terminal domain-containing protein n=1 Tax=Desulfofundulus sp. TPOSR TaxID=2714340 RepID=UPI0014080AAE|nr:copper amine oxidase N-terminal domain-containing protein [Desulfofundulus sp. TPOSR]NHM26897.1 copper amine oxidase N-terminal domain-containing protein [Desulfofundulus sp. TPOSR]
MNTTSSAKVEVLASDGSQLTISKVVYKGATSVSAVNIGGTAVSTDGQEVVIPSGSKSFTLEITPTGADAAKVNFYMVVDAKDKPAGDIKANFFSTTGQLDPGQVVVARAAGGAVTVALVGSVPTFGTDFSKQVTIRLSENTAGALKSGTSSVKIKLPAGFKWSSAGPATGDVTAAVDGSSSRVLNVNVSATRDTSVAQTFDITGTIEVDDEDVAKMGDVVATVEGGNNTSVSPSELTVAKYDDYGVNVSVASVKELKAGILEQKTDKITIEEKIPGSLIKDRKVTVKLPDWVKVQKLVDPSTSNATNNLPTTDINDNKFSFTVQGTSGSSKAKYEFKMSLSIEAGRTGDIEAVVSGAGIPDAKIVVAKAITPVTASAQPTDVKIGVQAQAAPDLTITEAKGGAIKAGTNRSIAVILPPGVQFAAVPKVEVTSGDLEIKAEQVTVTDAVYTSDDKVTYAANRVLNIPVKAESIKASTIKISGIKLTLDRTVPEGALMVKVGGYAVVENYGSGNAQFRSDVATEAKLANVVTPAPGEQKSTVVFKVSDTKFTVNGVEQTMDVAPYIKNGRTYVPVRYSAQAVGVAADNILYSGGKVTLIKGDKVVQFTIGSNVMLINGVAINMDVKAEITNGRTMLPFRYVAQALGAQVNWDPTEQTVTMTL